MEIKKFYIRDIVREINKEIRKEEKYFFFFIKLYVNAMKIIEKNVEEKKKMLKEKLTRKQYQYYCKKNFICETDLISLYKDVLYRIQCIHFNKKIIFI